VLLAVRLGSVPPNVPTVPPMVAPAGANEPSMVPPVPAVLVLDVTTSGVMTGALEEALVVEVEAAAAVDVVVVDATCCITAVTGAAAELGQRQSSNCHHCS